ncbi:MAG: 50S ribosomal protein L11 methyltransferase [Polyangia bacterium]
MKRDAWPCLVVHTDVDRADDLCWELWERGADSVEVRDRDTLSAGAGETSELRAGFEEARIRDRVAEEISRLEPAARVEAIEVVDDGWSVGWREFFSPVELEILRVVTPWMEPSDDRREVIVIDPGAAFGTGGHATTRLVLEMIEARALSADLPLRVLDVGTGSGVLAVAAAKLGAGLVEGIDNDPEAVRAAEENLRVNRVEEIVSVRCADPREVSGGWPLVLANLELPVFRDCAERIARLVAPGGEALLSGLLVDQVNPCLELWPGFEERERRDREGWGAVAVRRPI